MAIVLNYRKRCCYRTKQFALSLLFRAIFTIYLEKCIWDKRRRDSMSVSWKKIILKRMVSFVLMLIMVLNGSFIWANVQNIYAAETELTNVSCSEWIREHREYVSSEEFNNEIVRGFSGELYKIFEKVRKDKTISSYNTLDSVNKILEFDLEGISDTQEYELLLAQIFFNYNGDQTIQNTFEESMADTILQLGELLVLDKGAKLQNVLDKDTRDSVKAILQSLRILSPGDKRYDKELNGLFDLIAGYDNIEFRKNFMHSCKSAKQEFIFGVALDEAELLDMEFRELIMYLAVGEAYSKTSGTFGNVLLSIRSNIGIRSKNPMFDPYMDNNLVTEEQIWDLTSTNNSKWQDPLNAPVRLSDLAAAIENFYLSIEKYKSGNAEALADQSIEDLAEGTMKVL